MEIKVYTNRNYGIEIMYPGDWQLTENYAGTVAMITSPRETPTDKFNENINIVVQDLTGQSVTLEDYNKISIDQLKQAITKFKMVGSLSKEMLSGNPASKITFKGQHSKLKLKWSSIWTVTKNKAYILTCTAQPDSFDRFVSLFKEIVLSFKIL